MMFNFYCNKFNYLIGEIKVWMIIFVIVVDKFVNEEKINEIFDQVFEDEFRFSGLYMLNVKGDVIVSMIDLKLKVNLVDRLYFMKVRKMKKMVIINDYFSRIIGQCIFMICVFVLDVNWEVIDYLVVFI